MKIPCTRSCALLCSGALVALACGAAGAAETGGSRNFRTVYQQRLPDGSLLLTDRPPHGSGDKVIEQRWTFPVEDAGQAASRRAALRAEHEEVNTRLNRLVQQRERLDAEMALERMRLASTRAWLAAEHERAQRWSTPATVVVPVWSHPHPHSHLRLQRPGSRGPFLR